MGEGIAMATEADDTDTGDRVVRTEFANEQIDWQFDGMPGWSRTDRDGRSWNYYGPLDGWAAPILLRHFGLELRAAEFPLSKLQFTHPGELRALGNRAELKIVAAAG